VKCPTCGTGATTFHEFVSIEGASGTGRKVTICFNLECPKARTILEERLTRVENCVDVTKLAKPQEEDKDDVV